MAVNLIIECFWRDLVPEYCHGLESSTFHTTPPIFVKSVHGRSNRSPPRLPLPVHAEDIIPTLLTSTIYIGICLPKAITLTRPRSYEMFKVSLIIRMNKTVGIQWILNFHLLRDTFLYRLARVIPPKEGVPYPLQYTVRTLPHHLRWTILALQISVNAWLPPRLLRTNGQ